MDLSGENKLPWPVYKPYFFLDESNITGTSYKVYCLLCYPTRKVLSTSRCSASNLLRHLRKLHPTEVPKLPVVGPGNKKSVAKRKSVQVNSQQITLHTLNSDRPELLQILNQPIIDQQQVKMDISFNEDFTTQHKVDQLMIDFIVNGLHSPSIVERPEFQNLITGLQPGKTIMARITLENIISENASNFKGQLRRTFSEISHLATTADGWRVFNRSYIGITAQWIDPSSLDRRSAVLGCRRIPGAHTYQEIGRIIEEVHEEYGIQNKVVQMTTDNGINFARDCRVFRLDASAEEEIEVGEQDYEFVELTPILDIETEESALYNIPSHERCAAHTMYLVATNDTRKAEEDALYKDAMKESLSRCQSLWKMQSSSLQNAEFVKEKLGNLIAEPKDSQWSSQYEALKHIRQLFADKMDIVNEICDELDISRFREVDKVFIDEYCKVMKPIAAALDALQSDCNAYLGILLPVLHALKRRLIHFRNQASNQDLLVVCYPLLEAVIEGLDKRFSSLMFRRDLVLASVLHPEFQLNWMKDPEKESVAAECLKEAIREISEDSEQADQTPEEDDDDLFDFKKPTAANRSEKCQTEVDQYLSFCTGQIKCLQSYPLIKNLFIQYNSAIPSSAAIEKTFTAAGDIFTLKGGVLADATSEDMLLVKTGIK